MSEEEIIKNLLTFIGENPEREGLKATPKRVIKAWQFWTSGYKKDIKEIMTTFNSDGFDQMIVVKEIDFYSHCEHHLAPFYGKIHIGYIPNGKVLGVSKFARLIEIFSRRLQIQERMTKQIADTIMEYLKPKGVAVIIEGIHLCMRSRGVEKQNSIMQTSCMLGSFREQVQTRNEFFQMIKS